MILGQFRNIFQPTHLVHPPWISSLRPLSPHLTPPSLSSSTRHALILEASAEEAPAVPALSPRRLCRRYSPNDVNLIALGERP